MKKLLMLIPASLFLTMTMAQNTNSAVSPKTAALDGKSFKITLTNLGSENMNTQPTDNTHMDPDKKPGDMGMQDKTPMDKTTGNDQAQTGTDKNVTSKTATLKFKGGMLKSSFAGSVKGKECSYTTTSSAAATDAVTFTSVCSNDMNTGSMKSSQNTGDKANQSSGDLNSTGSSGTTVPGSNSSGTDPNAQGSGNMSSTASRVEWTGTVSGNSINGTVKITENGLNSNYSFTGTMMDMSGQIGMEE